MDSEHVRQVWLEHGGSLTKAGAALGITKQLVDYHVRKANREHPLTYQEGSPANQRAMMAYVRACLVRAGITR